MTEGQTGSPISDRMQSLLAQAAEDQLTEQRALSEALTEVRGQLGQITAEMSALRSEVHAPDEALGAVSGEVRDAVGQISDRIDGLTRMVHQRGLDLAELRGTVSELQTATAQSTPDYNALTAQLGPLAQSIAGLQDSFRAESTRGANLAAQLGQLREQLGTVAATAQSAHADSESLARRLDGMQEDITAIGGNVAGLVESGAGDDHGRMDEIAVQVADVRAALVGDDGLESQVAALTQQISALERRVEDGAADERVTAVVSDAVAASEQRLCAYLDEAVLALAEVLLRRGPSGRGSGAGPDAVPDVESEAFVEPEAGPESPETDLEDLSGQETGFDDDAPEAELEPDLEADGDADTDSGFETEESDTDGGLEADGDTAAEPDPVPTFGLPAAPDVPPHGLPSFFADPSGSEPAAPEDAADEAEVADAEAADAVEDAGAGTDDWLDRDPTPDPTQVTIVEPEPWDLPDGALGQTGPESGGEPEADAEPEQARDAVPVSAQTSDDWHAEVTSEVTVESKRKRKPWWRPGD